MYADIETVLMKSEGEGNILQTNVLCAVSSYLVAHKGLNCIQLPVRINQGWNCVQEFCEELDALVREIYNFNQLNCRKPQIRTPETVTRFDAATLCE